VAATLTCVHLLEPRLGCMVLGGNNDEGSPRFIRNHNWQTRSEEARGQEEAELHFRGLVRAGIQNVCREREKRGIGSNSIPANRSKADQLDVSAAAPARRHRRARLTPCRVGERRRLAGRMPTEARGGSPARRTGPYVVGLLLAFIRRGGAFADNQDACYRRGTCDRYGAAARTGKRSGPRSSIAGSISISAAVGQNPKCCGLVPVAEEEMVDKEPKYRGEQAMAVG
jgi:hypothetical protein